MAPEASATEPAWFAVVGGPLPAEVLLRDGLLALLVPAGLLLCSAFCDGVLRYGLVGLALVLAPVLGMTVRRRFFQQQGVRVVGNVLEHRSGLLVERLALGRAMVSAAAAPPGVLVLVLDDGRTHLAVARRAQPHELTDLPPRLGAYLELVPEDFEEVRIAAHRSYPRA